MCEGGDQKKKMGKRRVAEVRLILYAVFVFFPFLLHSRLHWQLLTEHDVCIQHLISGWRLHAQTKPSTNEYIHMESRVSSSNQRWMRRAEEKKWHFCWHRHKQTANNSNNKNGRKIWWWKTRIKSSGKSFYHAVLSMWRRHWRTPNGIVMMKKHSQMNCARNEARLAHFRYVKRIQCLGLFSAMRFPPAAIYCCHRWIFFFLLFNLTFWGQDFFWLEREMIPESTPDTRKNKYRKIEMIRDIMTRHQPIIWSI